MHSWDWNCFSSVRKSPGQTSLLIRKTQTFGNLQFWTVSQTPVQFLPCRWKGLSSMAPGRETPCPHSECPARACSKSSPKFVRPPATGQLSRSPPNQTPWASRTIVQLNKFKFLTASRHLQSKVARRLAKLLILCHVLIQGPVTSFHMWHPFDQFDAQPRSAVIESKPHMKLWLPANTPQHEPTGCQVISRRFSRDPPAHVECQLDQHIACYNPCRHKNCIQLRG